jgi:hypothetical protein
VLCNVCIGSASSKHLRCSASREGRAGRPLVRVNGFSRRSKTSPFTFSFINGTLYFNVISVFVHLASWVLGSSLGLNGVNCIVGFLYLPWSRIIGS